MWHSESYEPEQKWESQRWTQEAYHPEEYTQKEREGNTLNRAQFIWTDKSDMKKTRNIESGTSGETGKGVRKRESENYPGMEIGRMEYSKGKNRMEWTQPRGEPWLTAQQWEREQRQMGIHTSQGTYCPRREEVYAEEIGRWKELQDKQRQGKLEHIVDASLKHQEELIHSTQEAQDS